MAQRGRKGLAKHPLFKAPRTRATADPTRPISSRHHPSAYETTIGLIPRARWRKLSDFEKYWLQRDRSMWPPGMKLPPDLR
jgi:hypothetical protein